MGPAGKTHEELRREIEDLRARLQEAEETLRAIRSGEVDALVVSGPQGEQVYTLKGADHTYRVLIEEMKEGAATLTVDGTILYANSRLAEMLRTPLEKVIGSSVHRFVEQPHQQMGQALLQQGKQGAAKGELTLRAEDGAQVPVLASVSPLRMQGAPVLCMVVTDLTEQKRYEEIVAAERLARSILDQAAQAIVVCDGTGRIIRASHTARQLCGQNPMLQPFDAVFPLQVAAQPERAAGGPFSLVDVLRGERLRDIEVCLTLRDGQVRSLLLSAGPLLGAQGEVLGCVVTLTDITERRRAERELERQARELARSNAELEQFAYIASHDLQEPLRTVGSFVELLARRYRGKLDEDADDFIEFIVDGAARMQRLIENLLAYSRVTTKGREFQPADCTAALGQAVVNLQLAIQQSGAVVTNDDLPTVMADEAQLVQLFQNLVDNAIKFRREEPPRVHVSAEQGEGEWVFRVRDNGIGIDPGFFHRIFQMLQRWHGRGDYPGAGIGLALCKKIAERHGGRIWVESKLGKGSTFSFAIPFEGAGRNG